MKKTPVVLPADQLAAHELAALEIGELRRKGVPCHLEDHSGRGGHRIDIVREEPESPRLDRGVRPGKV